MNEIIFFFYVFLLILAPFLTIRLGKEAIFGLIAIEWLVMNLFVAKEITLFGVAATASDAITIGIALALNMLQRAYGRSSAEQAIIMSTGLSILFALLSFLHCAYIPCLTDHSHIHYAAILLPMPRIILASLLVSYISQTIDVRLYSRFKQLLPSWGTRVFFMSAAISQFVDTILFSLLALYGIIDHLGQIIIFSYTIKLITLAIAAPLVSAIQKIRDHVVLRNYSSID